MSNRLYKRESSPFSRFPKLQTFSESVKPLSRNRDPNLTQNEYVYEIWCRKEVAGDVISGWNIKTAEGYSVLNFETASLSSFREYQIQPFA